MTALSSRGLGSELLCDQRVPLNTARNESFDFGYSPLLSGAGLAIGRRMFVEVEQLLDKTLIGVLYEPSISHSTICRIIGWQYLVAK
jgi:hypothetical protein